MAQILGSRPHEIYPAAAEAIPFLVRVAASSHSAIQSGAMQLLAYIAWCANFSNDVLDKNSAAYAARIALLNCRDTLSALANSTDVDGRKHLAELLEQLSVELRPCPNCGQKLRSPQAKQCFHCGHDWH